MAGKTTEERGELNEQAGPSGSSAGRLKGDRALEARDSSSARGLGQKTAGAAVRKATEDEDPERSA